VKTCRLQNGHRLPGPRPKTLRIGDLAQLLSSPKLFAHIFDAAADESTTSQLDGMACMMLSKPPCPWLQEYGPNMAGCLPRQIVDMMP
jgi:hypothetical protein